MKTAPKIRRRIKLAAFSLVLAGGLTLFFANTLTDYAYGISAPGGIYIPGATHQFSKGEAKAGVYSHTFRIYNLRPRFLQIAAQADCGCTGVSWKEARIAPFSWKELTAKMQDRGAGSTSVGVVLQTDDPTKKWVFVFLKS